MENFLLVARQVAILFILIGAGVVCRRTRLVDEFSIRGMINVLIMLVTPALVIECFQRPFDSSMLSQFAVAFFIGAAMHAFLILLSRFTARGDGRTLPVLRVATVFSNAGFMGIPLEYAILGPKGVFYGIVYVAMFNLFMWSWGLMVMKNGRWKAMGAAAEDASGGWKASDLRPMVLNPGTVGLLIGFPLFLLSVTLPEIVRTPMKMLSDLNTPLAMIVIGYYLAGADLRAVARSRQAWFAAFLRLVVSPLALIAVFRCFRTRLDPAMMLALVIASSAPVAALVAMFASRYSRDVDLAVGLVSGTTLLSILTMPPVIALAMTVLCG